MFNKVCIKMYKSTLHNSSKDKTTVKIQTSYVEGRGTGVNSRKDHYHFNDLDVHENRMHVAAQDDLAHTKDEFTKSSDSKADINWLTSR